MAGVKENLEYPRFSRKEKRIMPTGGARLRIGCCYEVKPEGGEREVQGEKVVEIGIYEKGMEDQGKY